MFIEFVNWLTKNVNLVIELLQESPPIPSWGEVEAFLCGFGRGMDSEVFGRLQYRKEVAKLNQCTKNHLMSFYSLPSLSSSGLA